MVTRGQFLERAVLVQVPQGPVLDGLWHRGKRTPPVLVIPPPHGQGGMDHIVAAELAYASAHAGHAVLRFNHRGVGASQGKPGGAGERLADAQAALRLLLDNTEDKAAVVVALPGSGETALALAGATTEVGGLVLVSPTPRELGDLVARALPALVVVGSGEKLRPVEPLGGHAQVTWETIDTEDALFSKSLPQVGRVLAFWLARQSGE